MAAEKILIIDDEQGIREGARRALSPLGYQVDIAENGQIGLEKVNAETYDLVLLDVMMPGKSGIDLITDIHNIDPEIVCVMITGFATVELAVRAIKQGAYDFLTKPFSIDQLILSVNQGLERRRLSLDARRLQSVEKEASRLAEDKARLEAIDKAKMQFIRLVTHELQAPVAAIQSYLRLILEDYVPHDRQKEIIERCMSRADEEMSLIADLLELGKMQSIHPSVKVERVNLVEVLKSLVEPLQSQATEKSLDFVLHLPDKPVFVMGDKDRFKYMWSNLISNAIKYTQKGQVMVNLEKRDDYCRGEVSDTGIGIPEDELPNLFNEFFRASNAKAQRIPGTGLGLVIVKKIIEEAGGKLELTSKLSEGTSFILTLPLADPQ